MAKGKIKGPIGPIMLLLLVGIAIFMIFVVQSPELAEKFKRPEDFYENMFGKVGIALLFAFVASAVFTILRRTMK